MIVPLHAGNPGPMTGGGNWTYFVPGRSPLLIDAGVGVPAHVELIAGARGDGPEHVVVTHAHPDHITGVAALASRWPVTRFSKLPYAEVDRKYLERWQALRDGEMVAAGDGELEVIHTPGHAPDHIALWDASTRTLLSGDLVVRGTTVVIPASRGGSLASYLRSLERILSLNPARLLPAHGDAIDDPAPLIHQYIAHRLEREQQIRRALSAGPRSAAEVVEQIYQGLPAPLVPMARESVLAHLIKLEAEDAVVRDGDMWVCV